MNKARFILETMQQLRGIGDDNYYSQSEILRAVKNRGLDCSHTYASIVVDTLLALEMLELQPKMDIFRRWRYRAVN